MVKKPDTEAWTEQTNIEMFAFSVWYHIQTYVYAVIRRNLFDKINLSYYKIKL